MLDIRFLKQPEKFSKHPDYRNKGKRERKGEKSYSQIPVLF